MIHQYWTKSFTDPKKKYLVRYDKEESKWRCSCLHYLMRERYIDECKHIEKIKKSLSVKKELKKDGSPRIPNQVQPGSQTQDLAESLEKAF